MLLEMKTFRKRAKHEKSSVLIREARGKMYEKVFYKLWAREEAGFNTVMSNLKFQHNKSGFHDFFPNKKKETFAY